MNNRNKGNTVIYQTYDGLTEVDGKFEQHGEGRAQYGEQLLKQLAKKIKRKGMEWRRLYEFRTFYMAYQQLKDEIVSFIQSQWQGLTQKQTKKLQPLAAIFEPVRDQMAMEFLGIPTEAVYTETKLETAILNNLQKFLLELGQGFCFEAGQKRVLIDHDYFKAEAQTGL